MGVIDTAREAITLVQKLDNVELLQKILALQSDALKMVEENGELKTKVRELEEAFKIKDSLVFENNSYYIGEKKDGPYCSLCWDTDRRLVHLHKDEANWWWCLIHQKEKHYLKVY